MATMAYRARSRLARPWMFVGVILFTPAVANAHANATDHVRLAPRSPVQPGRDRWADGLVYWDVRDADRGQPIPCKLTFTGVRGTINPEFTRVDIGRPEGDLAIAAFERVFSAVGEGDLRVPPGDYEVSVSRGIEWDVVKVPLKVTPEGGRIEARLRQVIGSRGWISADFHVHAAPSPDSVVPLSHRVLEFIADGIDLITATDHNVVTDYGPTIRAMGLEHLITSVRGDEITTNGWGHFGAFPLRQDLTRAGQGAILAHGRTPDTIFRDVRRLAPEAVIDVHHPRLDMGIGYFTIGEFDPHSDLARKKGFSLDFDALEVLNGYQDPSRASVDKTIDDWLGLLNHGHIVTATGNSDTHHLTYNIGGYPRNYLRVEDDRIERVSPTDVSRALHARHAFFTTGPFLRISSGRGGIGDLVDAPHGQASLRIQVDAAPWISVHRVILYVDGKERKRWPVPPSQAITRIAIEEPLRFEKDGYVVVRVDGDQLMAPVVGDAKIFTVYPLALSNPIFFDVNRNGRFDPAYRHGPH
jgi:hypothetical protein